jgi:hypothetical protein
MGAAKPEAAYRCFAWVSFMAIIAMMEGPWLASMLRNLRIG